jgi:hypothetical protein
MRIVLIEIDNFRGIKSLRWAPGAKVNCLIGPGDSTKTTVLDAIELALNPRSYSFADDSDFHNLDYEKDVNIVVTVGGLPSEFSADDRYGMHLRGWNNETSKIEDEPGTGLEDVLSLRVTVDKTHEARWSLYNDRITADEESDPPALRYRDSQLLATTRLGPYAERHLGWSRLSVLNRLGDTSDTLGGQLADANRAARVAFSKGNPEVFKETAERAEKLSRHFAVPVREKYAAELDVQGVNITAGGISLHDGKLPLRRLGTGSSRLIVSALQHDARGSHVALIDEIEHGLEPHRIARLLKYLSFPPVEDGNRLPSQIFMTTHSPVVIRELTAGEISAVRSVDGVTEIQSIVTTAKSPDAAQRHLRGVPDAFLARKIVVCEGRTEQGLARGLDHYWTTKRKLESFALRGAIAVDGNGNGSAPILADHLVNLGYDVFLLLDSDEKVDDKVLNALKTKGVCVYEWTGGCATEERMMLDAPWTVVAALVALAAESVTADSVQAQINKVCKARSLPALASLDLPASLDSAAFRSAVGRAAKNDDRSWFKDITRGERLADILGPSLEKMTGKPLSEGIATLRKWIDG